MMFDAQVTAVGMDVYTPEEDENGNVAEGPVTLAIALAMLLPGPQGPMPMQVGIVRVPFAAKVARDLAQQLIEAADKMPEPTEPSGLVVASPADMQNVAAQAAAADSLKQGKPKVARKKK